MNGAAGGSAAPAAVAGLSRPRSGVASPLSQVVHIAPAARRAARSSLRPARQSGCSSPKWRSAEQSSREFSGRGAGTGYAALAISSIVQSSPASSMIARAARPACHGLPAQMIDTRQVGPIDKPPAHAQAGPGNRCRRGRSADLVGHHAQAVALCTKTQHGLDEICPMRREDPVCAQDRMHASCRAHPLFPFQFRAPIGPQRDRGMIGAKD